MKSKAILSLLAVAAMGYASLASAQGHAPMYHNGSGYGHASAQRDFDRHDVRQARQERQERYERQARREERREERRDDRREARQDFRAQQYNARGPQFYRGGRIPQEYRSHQYVVNDWRSHRLISPTRGQQWVQVGSDYALIVAATGVIAQLVLR